MKQTELTAKFINDFARFKKTNPALVSKIEKIINNIKSNSILNFHKGEKLKYYTNRYSYRIDKTNRLIYKKYDDKIILLSCKGHYE